MLFSLVESFVFSYFLFHWRFLPYNWRTYALSLSIMSWKLLRMKGTHDRSQFFGNWMSASLVSANKIYSVQILRALYQPAPDFERCISLLYNFTPGLQWTFWVYARPKDFDIDIEEPFFCQARPIPGASTINRVFQKIDGWEVLKLDYVVWLLDGCPAKSVYIAKHKWGRCLELMPALCTTCDRQHVVSIRNIRRLMIKDWLIPSKPMIQ